jgi:hypothetical protein
MTETVVGADASAPQISILHPAANAVFSRGEVVDAQYSCTDTDLVSCSGPVDSGSPIPTGAVGAHTFTVTASDMAGHQASRTIDYTVYAADGSGQMTVSPAAVSASSAHHTLSFAYEAARGGILHATVTLVVPAGWSAPSTSPAAPGYVTSSAGKVSVSGRTITVSIHILASRHTLTITYGSRAAGGSGATSPSATGKQTWQAREQSVSDGTLTELASPPQVTVT